MPTFHNERTDNCAKGQNKPNDCSKIHSGRLQNGINGRNYPSNTGLLHYRQNLVKCLSGKWFRPKEKGPVEAGPISKLAVVA